MSIKISSIQGISAMSANFANRYTRTNPDTKRNPLSFPAFPHTFQGTAAGYTSGGTTGTVSNVIDKFPFATNANATDVGDLTVAAYDMAGQQV